MSTSIKHYTSGNYNALFMDVDMVTWPLARTPCIWSRPSTYLWASRKQQGSRLTPEVLAVQRRVDRVAGHQLMGPRHLLRAVGGRHLVRLTFDPLHSQPDSPRVLPYSHQSRDRSRAWFSGCPTTKTGAGQPLKKILCPLDNKMFWKFMKMCQICLD